MRVDILTVLPEMIEPFIGMSMLKRAQEKGLAEIVVHNLRDYTTNKWRRVDDYPFGGAAGMVMQIEPVERAIETLRAERPYDEVIFTSPDGDLLDQPTANSLSLKENIIILCGHYKGIDQRIRDHLITREISIGDYVLTGGELPAAVIADSIIRLIPGVLGDEESALSDSFQDNLLAPPIYTRPADWHGWRVPDVLLSGNERLIREWEYDRAVERTKKLRPHLLEGNGSSQQK
ncbi:MAG: tRNA (guanosine(37)-N1)-methyltransferase TrmD [Porphyromonas sp.]|uniref:tRNA (guanosine(37)-N1)-methyltransferase TrmD n=1 Tax=Porphyromonas sp. TaxID=1924944 RepID=UPI002A91E74F|nr:tRNA (guanosine(37)-N1)-methyltransferase TrmD [Porphyromonas sp.]MDD6920010.1 tRNA (guanosine(37)-N1)-methyltransferase TrmD [Eubacteriales bacterium]MDY6101635.1 tRNA (guanosine(37)-N1)-methyltransferase TrmD [Porphyromonas sp.]